MAVGRSRNVGSWTQKQLDYCTTTKMTWKNCRSFFRKRYLNELMFIALSLKQTDIN